MDKFAKFIESVLGLTMVEFLAAHKNNFDKAHELVIKDLLIQVGFTEIQPNDLLASDCFIHEPNGSQQSPDFRVKFGDSVIEIDLKSSASGVIMWNSHLPKADTLYIYSKIKGKMIYDTTVFLGKDINFDLESLTTALATMDSIAKEYNILHPNSDIHLYNRKMFVDKVGNLLSRRNKTRRITMESNVKQYILKGSYHVA